MQFFHGTKIDFMRVRTRFFYISAALTVAAIVTVAVLGVDFGIDFTGGSELAVKFSKTIHTDEIRESIDKAGFVGAEIKSFGETNQFLIRMRESGKAAERAVDVLRKDFPEENITLLKQEAIGPKIGKELFNMGLLAVVLSVIAIMLYLAFRFEFKFGLGAVVALVHDVVITFGIINVVHHLGWINIEFNQNMIAAMLTVLGYSVNDTVIVFDRVRENADKHKGIHYTKLINLSINETLSRTINTVLTVVLVLITIVLFGGPVLQGFAFTMLVGITFGTYSSVYVATSFVVWFMHKIKKVDVEDPEAVKAISAKV
jgi:preprotein translocase SecF subunit